MSPLINAEIQVSGGTKVTASKMSVIDWDVLNIGIEVFYESPFSWQSYDILGKKFTHLPPYIIYDCDYSNAGKPHDIPLVGSIPISLLSSELQGQGITDYELIGIVINDGGAHYYAYVKDQVGTQKAWWICDDLNKNYTQVKNTDEITKFASQSRLMPTIAVYKKIIDPALEELANALSAIANK